MYSIWKPSTYITRSRNLFYRINWIKKLALATGNRKLFRRGASREIKTLHAHCTFFSSPRVFSLIKVTHPSRLKYRSTFRMKRFKRKDKSKTSYRRKASFCQGWKMEEKRNRTRGEGIIAICESREASIRKGGGVSRRKLIDAINADLEKWGTRERDHPSATFNDPCHFESFLFFLLFFSFTRFQRVRKFDCTTFFSRFIMPSGYLNNRWVLALIDGCSCFMPIQSWNESYHNLKIFKWNVKFDIRGG